MSVAIDVCLVAAALLGHGYLWMEVVNRLHGWAGPRLVIDRITDFCLIAFFVLPGLFFFCGGELVANLRAGPTQSVGLAARYFQICIILAVIFLLLKWFASRRTNHPQTLLQRSREMVAHGDTRNPYLFVGAYARLLARLPGNQVVKLSVDRKTVAIPRLHPRHVGITIAHLSDLHITGQIAKSWFITVIEEVNRLQPDVVMITGDIIENESCWPWLAETLGKLQAPLGVYFILGNHDVFINFQQTRKLLTDAGLICLSGRWLQADWNGAPVILAGNERPWLAECGQLDDAPSRDPENLPLRLFLLHTPDQYDWAVQHDVDLALAGHTHGGQICFPLIGAVACPSLHGTRHIGGVYRQEKSVLHVTRGISGTTPFRWFCPPEIALLKLAEGSPPRRTAKSFQRFKRS